MRAMAVLLLHQQAFHGGPPAREEMLKALPGLEPVRPAGAWYARAWEWLRRRYLLLDWEA